MYVFFREVLVSVYNNNGVIGKQKKIEMLPYYLGQGLKRQISELKKYS